MHIQFVEVSNFRKLKATHIDFAKDTTIFVGANNSGKTSAMTALRYFLVSPKSLALRDVTIANWRMIDVIGQAWERGETVEHSLDELLPSLDVWLHVPLYEIRHVIHILPSLDWTGGDLGVRLQYYVVSMEKLKTEYSVLRAAASSVAAKVKRADGESLEMWPLSLTDYLSRELGRHVGVRAFPLDPTAKTPPSKGVAQPQKLSGTVQPLRALVVLDAAVLVAAIGLLPAIYGRLVLPPEYARIEFSRDKAHPVERVMLRAKDSQWIVWNVETRRTEVIKLRDDETVVLGTRRHLAPALTSTGAACGKEH